MIAGNLNPNGLSPNFIYQLLSDELSKQQVTESLDDLLNSGVVFYSGGKIKLSKVSMYDS